MTEARPASQEHGSSLLYQLKNPVAARTMYKAEKLRSRNPGIEEDLSVFVGRFIGMAYQSACAT